MRTRIALLFLILELASRVAAARSWFPFLEGSASVAMTIRCGAKNDGQHEIVKEELLFSRWRTIISRLVRFPNGREVDFDVVGQAGSDRAVLIFAWDCKTKTATLIQEYMPGSNSVKYGVAAGLVEDKHNGGEEDPCLIAAKFELEEEAHLVGGTWLQLTDGDSILDKYATTVVRAYLVLDAEKESNPKPLDDEEDITIAPGVSVSSILEMIVEGKMNVVGGWASLLAIQKLRELGEIP